MQRVTYGEPKPQRPPSGGLLILRAPRGVTRAPNYFWGKDLWLGRLLSTWPAVNPSNRPYWPGIPQLSDSQGRWRVLFNNPGRRGAFGDVATQVIG